MKNLKKSLEDLRAIFPKNNYPSWHVEQKSKSLLENDKKPPREENLHTFCLDYNFHRLHFHAKQLIKKVKQITPDISINLCHRSIKISQLFFYTFKPINETFTFTNCIYKFRCFLSSSYIDQSCRPLKKRAQEHQEHSKSSGILEHCKIYETT